MIIRNDDVAYDTRFDHFRRFCELCDRYGYQILQAITPRGTTIPIEEHMSNEQIRSLSPDAFFADNKPVLDYLLSRDDLIGIHGLWHSHEVSEYEIWEAKGHLIGWGLKPTYFVPPFNEGSWPRKLQGLKVVGKIQRLEDYLRNGVPTDPIVYLHSWRFDGSFYTLEELNRCLSRISAMML